MTINEDRKLTLDEHFEIVRRKFEMSIKKHSENRVPLSELKNELNISNKKHEK